MKFKERNYLHNMNVQDEATSTDIEAATSCPQDQAKIITESDYTQQIFSVDKTAFYWKMMASRTFIA